MIILLQLPLYVLLVIGVVVLLCYSSAGGRLQSYRRGLALGLLASPLGFVLPYAAMLGMKALRHGPWPTNGIPVIDPVAQTAVTALFVLGPVVGPPAIVFFFVRRCTTSLRPNHALQRTEVGQEAASDHRA